MEGVAGVQYVYLLYRPSTDEKNLNQMNVIGNVDRMVHTQLNLGTHHRIATC